MVYTNINKSYNKNSERIPRGIYLQKLKRCAGALTNDVRYAQLAKSGKNEY